MPKCTDVSIYILRACRAPHDPLLIIPGWPVTILKFSVWVTAQLRGITKNSSHPVPRPVLSCPIPSRPVPRPVLSCPVPSCPVLSRLVPPNSYLESCLVPFHYLLSTKFFSSFLSVRETASNPYFLVQ